MVAVVVRNGPTVLLCQAPDGPWDLPRAEVLPFEPLATAAQRSVKAKTGLTITAVKQSVVHEIIEVPDRHDLYFVFEAAPSGGTLTPGDCVAEARWFFTDELAAQDVSSVVREVLVGHEAVEARNPSEAL